MSLAQEAADYFNTHKIWINTGTFGQKYESDLDQQFVSATQSNQQDIELFDRINSSQNKGYKYALNYFLADKLHTKEQTDFSLNKTKEEQETFRNLVRLASQNNVELSIFDR